jgi:hypothetical protein
MSRRRSNWRNPLPGSALQPSRPATRPAPIVDASADPAAYREQARWLRAEAAKLPATQASWLLETAARFSELADLSADGGSEG